MLMLLHTMRRLLWGAVLIPIILVIFSLVSIHIGQAMDNLPVSLNGIDDCELPCWARITPRQTLLEIANGLMLESDYELIMHNQQFRVMNYRPPEPALCDVSFNYSSGAVLIVMLRQCPNVRLGDILAVLGTPERITFDTKALSFRDGRVIVHVSAPDCYVRLSPRSRVSVIYLTNPGRLPPRRRVMEYTPENANRSFPWLGFLTREQYHNAIPSFPNCQ
jgi:hypothetical protein